MVENMKKYLFLIVTGLITFVSCSKNDKIVEKTLEFPNHKWERIDEKRTVVFDSIEINNTEDFFNISIGFRFGKNINVDAIDYVLKITYPDGIVKESLHSLKLKDRTGERFVGNDLGIFVEDMNVVGSYMQFAQKGIMKVEISNFSQKYEVNDIHSITLLIKKANLDVKLEK
jgi:hypothetical protein